MVARARVDRARGRKSRREKKGSRRRKEARREDEDEDEDEAEDRPTRMRTTRAGCDGRTARPRARVRGAEFRASVGLRAAGHASGATPTHHAAQGAARAIVASPHKTKPAPCGLGRPASRAWAARVARLIH
ncbi:unnamed protein product [Prorocentrum cordatum]|uniref:Uncharacterized protein n=1 Tax=Prorocentrum cordatum TaxID=2364126 RepID=A0ABN9TF26_9DINO|nr:unnamed protein product [Polarella glacialis]